MVTPNAFRLTRYFSFLSMLLVIIAGAMLSWIVHRQEIAHMERAAQDTNVSLTHLVHNALRSELDALLRAGEPHDGSDSEQASASAALRSRLVAWMSGSDVAKVKMYNPRGITIFSTEMAQIGEDKGRNPGFVSALQGQVVSELVHRDQFSAFEGERGDVDLVSSYIPVYEGDQVVAVFELYQDVTAEMRKIQQVLRQTSAAIGAILLGLYLVQLLVVRRAQGVIRTQAGHLEDLNRKLDSRVEERTRELIDSERQVSQLLAEQQLIFDNANVGILVLKDRRILKSNHKIAEMFGFASPDAFIGSSTEVFYASHDDFIRAGELGYALLREKGVANFECRMRRSDGMPIWIMQSGRPLDQMAVMESPSVWVYTDVTELKQAETELRIAATAFDAQQGMLVTDAQGVVLRVNRKLREMTGFSADELIGQTPRILLADDESEAIFDAAWQKVVDTGAWQGEIWGRRKDGVSFPKWLSISAVRNKSGRVTHYVGTYIDITERKEAEEKINQLAFFDQLTGLPNRTLLLDRLQQAIQSSARTGYLGAVVFMDLDQFKVLNDTKGHAQGDILLREVAQRLCAQVGQSETVARHGGDEFVVMLTPMQDDRAVALSMIETLCEQLVGALSEPYELSGMRYQCSASLGVACFEGHAASVEDLMRQADLAMYRSKKAGGNRFTFFDPEMEAAAVDYIRLTVELRAAIEQNQFELHYQPQVDGRDGRVVGAEALVRWQHPTRGLVMPGDFIPHAEQNGLIEEIGRCVLAAACRQVAAWAGTDLERLVLAVNVSAHQFRSPDFVGEVLSIFERTGVNPARLKLELTESVFAEDAELIVQRMHRLKPTGIGFSLDDFGTGYSSLSYLSRMPLDQLKIDRSFVTDLESNESHVTICAATISLAHSLHLKVVAEGVETELQRYVLGVVHHCDVLQGYHFSKPMPLAAFEAYCRSRSLVGTEPAVQAG